MAGRPRKDTTASSTKTTTVKTENAVVDTQEQLLKELQAQLAKLQAENEELKKQKDEKIEEEEELTSDTDIEVISQAVGRLILATEGYGMGTLYNFEEFGEVKDIPFGDLKDIVKNNGSFAKEGLFYVTNDQAVKKLRLNRFYDNLIDDKIFKNLFNMDSKTVIELYKTASKLQQEQIVSLIEDRLEKKLDVDGNILIQIGKLCGKDFLSAE